MCGRVHAYTCVCVCVLMCKHACVHGRVCTLGGCVRAQTNVAAFELVRFVTFISGVFANNICFIS